MLFNSYPFVFAFLPAVLLGFFLVARRSRFLAALWLALASLFFYGWWNPRYVLLLLASIGFNYAAGYAIGHAAGARRKAFAILCVAVGANLLVLGYFKYANFFMDAAGAAVGASWPHLAIILPLGISFFTFTQIAFLVDVYRGLAHEYRFVHYLFFVTWFPHLIAGPILHHKKLIPQLAHAATYRPTIENINTGLTILAIGLFKKTILADQFAVYANGVFDAPDGAAPPGAVDAWIAALTYTLQLYFDFSGYSDMAIGISRMFNIELPVNFNSPYKASSIIDFWRRWHMTLSEFLRDYLYFPLGGNRRGTTRRYANLMITMLLGGLWHGANWTYVLWGGLHGVFLVANHLWRGFLKRFRVPSVPGAGIAGCALTFLAVAFAWVAFRAKSFASAMGIWEGMLHGLPRDGSGKATLQALSAALTARDEAVWMITVGLLIVWGLPNAMQWVRSDGNAVFAWRPTVAKGLMVGFLLAVAIARFGRPSPFLYFQF